MPTLRSAASSDTIVVCDNGTGVMLQAHLFSLTIDAAKMCKWLSMCSLSSPALREILFRRASFLAW